MHKGRFSLSVAIIFMTLGGLSLIVGTLGALNGVFPPSVESIISQVGDYIGLIPGRWGLAEFGLLLIAFSSFVFGFRLRRPYSMFFPIMLIFIYGCVGITVRLWYGIGEPALVMQYFDETKKILMLVLDALVVVITFVLLALTSSLDDKWYSKRMRMESRLEEEGVRPTDETKEVWRAMAREKKDYEIEESRRRRSEKEYEEERENFEKAERRRIRRLGERDEKRYEKIREKEELRKDSEDEKALRRRMKAEDKAHERLEKEEKRKKRREEREKRAEDRYLERMGARPSSNGASNSKDSTEGNKKGERETERRPRTANDPIEFPDFMKTHFHAFSHEEDDQAPKTKRERREEEENKASHPESRSVINVTSEEMKREQERGAGEDSKEKVEEHRLDLSAKHFSSGGMMEATIEMMNDSNQKPDFPPGRIDGTRDERRRERPKETGASFAPSGLSPEHPRYKMFESISGRSGENTRQNTSNNNENREDKASFAPSNLSPEHPRYKMFEELGKKNMGVSHFPSKAFIPEEKSVEFIKSSPEPSFIEEEPKAKNSSDRTPQREPLGISETLDRKDEESASASIFNTPLFESAKEKRSTKSEAQRDLEARISEIMDAEVMERDEESVSYEKSGRDYDSSFNNLVGLSCLMSSKLMGAEAIRERSSRPYTAPPTDFLHRYERADSLIDEATIERGRTIVETYAQQKTEVEVENIIKGPTVTMFELRIGEGTLISRITGRSDELNYALGGKSVRILAPIRGKKAVGIEVPNDKSSVVGFRDLIERLNHDPLASHYKLPMILGKTITGEEVTIDVSKMPHMIIAGTTGSGKSVSINTFISTLIYRKRPQDVRLVLVDPKVVELSVYNGIPHLLTPVVTDVKRVIKVLNYLVDEMERRYQMLSNYGVRNIDSYNEKVDREGLESEKMPYVVLIIDELADLMTVARQEIETQITRLAAKARAAGIHMVLATQRPTTDVITGTIKSNLPGRIAFAVANALNSRVILDETGAEALLGRGDMLLYDPSNAVAGLRRIQGAFLSEDEVDYIATFAKRHAGTLDQLDEEIFSEESEDENDSASDDFDPAASEEELYEAARRLVVSEQRATTSYLQRRLKIGYNKAANLIEEMEERGVVGPANGSKPREILVSE